MNLLVKLVHCLQKFNKCIEISNQEYVSLLLWPFSFLNLNYHFECSKVIPFSHNLTGTIALAHDLALVILDVLMLLEKIKCR